LQLLFIATQLRNNVYIAIETGDVHSRKDRTTNEEGSKMTARPEVKGFFDKRTWSVQYVVSDPKTKRCAIIDPVLDYDEKSGSTGTMNADALLDYVKEQGLAVEWILDTHP